MSGGASTSETQKPLMTHQLTSIGSITPKAEDREGDGGHVGPENTLKGWILGDLTLSYFFAPISLYAKSLPSLPAMRFFEEADFVPLLLCIVHGLQQAIVAMSYVVAFPTILLGLPGWSSAQYTIQAAVIISGIATIVQSIELKIPYTPYQIGTGLSCFLGNSNIMLTVFMAGISNKIIQGEGTTEHLYGKLLGTCLVCTLFFIAISFIPRKYTKCLFAPIVTSIITILVGIEVTKLGIEYWGGGIDCFEFFPSCSRNGDVILDFGSHQYMGLGVLGVVLILLIELFGTGFLRHNIILFAAGITYAISAIIKEEGHRYVTGDEMDHADSVTFLWVETFHLGFDKYQIIPIVAAYLVTYLQATAVLTATVLESGIDINSPAADSKIQGGLITTGIMSFFALLATGMPLTPIPQSMSMISTTRVGSRYVGIAGGVWLIILGIFGKLKALVYNEAPIVTLSFVAILAAGVILSGIKILSNTIINRRNSIILFFSLAVGLGNIVTANGFVTSSIWPTDSDTSDFEMSLKNGVILAIGTSSFLGGIFAILLHLILPKDMELLAYVDSIPETHD